jgi:adenine-specific DNA-methyltransferase
LLFDTQDDIDRRREELIAAIEGKLQQRVARDQAFLIRWKMV